MCKSPTYRRLLGGDPTPSDAVLLRILKRDSETLAEVHWAENILTVAGDYIYPTKVPLAFERALDVQENYKFKEVVVILDDLRLWQDAWGALS